MFISVTCLFYAKTVQLSIGTRRCSFSTSKEAGALMFIVQQSSMFSVEPVKPSPSNKNNDLKLRLFNVVF
jgi:hypothetical protein